MCHPAEKSKDANKCRDSTAHPGRFGELPLCPLTPHQCTLAWQAVETAAHRRDQLRVPTRRSGGQREVFGSKSRKRAQIRAVSEQLKAIKQNIENLSCDDLQKELHADRDLLLVDIREIQEWVDLGTIPGAKHVPRGMLEFWADPHGPYFRSFFDGARRTVLFCAAGGRSALAVQAMKEMGYENVAHLDPGFNGWKKEGRNVEATKHKSRWIRRGLLSRASDTPKEPDTD